MHLVTQLIRCVNLTQCYHEENCLKGVCNFHLASFVKDMSNTFGYEINYWDIVPVQIINTEG